MSFNLFILQLEKREALFMSVSFLAEIEQALNNNEFIFHYQPKVSLLNGRANGAEALIRWIKPDGKTIQPNDFIPQAEKSGLIKKISIKMFPKLIADLVIIQDINPEIVMSFNLTGQDFESDAIVTCIRDAIVKFKVKPELLQIELTETSVINSSGEARQHIQTLVDMGIGLAMDDYGTGYSSIDLLSQWPFTVVKIDQGLIQRMLTSDKSTTIVQASIRMIHQLGIKIVAEGIESADVYDFLLNAGCTEAQGFWLSHPMSLANFLTFIKRDQRWSGIPIGLIHMAQLDHIQWRRSLVDQVMVKAFTESGKNGVQWVEAELDHRKCKLGQWYYSHGKEYIGFSAFDALEKPHQELHQLGRQLIDAISQDITRDEITKLLRQLTKKSGEVLGLLQELENEALLESGGMLSTLSSS
jgi:EAL domain-containing protein (putative c-di-GMP-specific phosphodiesterase class I)